VKTALLIRAVGSHPADDLAVVQTVFDLFVAFRGVKRPGMDFLRRDQEWNRKGRKVSQSESNKIGIAN